MINVAGVAAIAMSINACAGVHPASSGHHLGGHQGSRLQDEASMNLGVLQGALTQEADTWVLTVTNPTASPVYLSFNSGQNGDLALVAANGQVLWRWSESYMFTQAMRESTVAAGGVREVKFTVPAEVLAKAKPGMQWQASFNGRLVTTGDAAMAVTRVKIE